MQQRRIFVIWNHPLFIDAIRKLLEHPELALVGETADYRTAGKQVAAASPDLILIEEADGEQVQDVFHLLKTAAAGVPIIMLNLHDNQMNFYDRKQKIMANKDDLIQFCLMNQEVHNG